MAHDLALASGIATALIPGALGFALSRALRARARTARFLTSASAALAAAGAALCAGSLAVAGTAASGGGFAYVDGLTALLLLTVTLIGAVVARYSVRYLDGSPGQAAFSQWLSFVLSGVGLTLVAGNLAVFLAGSTATSLGLHRLLCYNAERPAAVLAARERFLLARVGDALLVIACALAYLQFGTLEFASIVGAVEAGGGIASGLMAFLLVGWAVTQSAQLPFHTWLPDTMEAPTPVSALMHAGIVNAGGYLLIRTSPLLIGP